MTIRAHDPSPAAPARHAGGRSAVRIGVMDSDPGFLEAAGRHVAAAGWVCAPLRTAVPIPDIVALRLDAVLVDVAVLGPQGWTYLDKLCGRAPETALVVHTRQSSVWDRVRGLRMGADDWIAKPCHWDELIARVEAVVRRRKPAPAEAPKGPTVAGEVEIRPDRFEAFVDGAPVGLTRREFELVQLLAEGEGIVFPREEIYERVWGYAMAHGDRSVDVFVQKLRAKLQRASPAWRYIHTHFGIGYRFAAEPAAGPEDRKRSPASRYHAPLLRGLPAQQDRALSADLHP